jgi:signal transduction histidine kinase
MVTTAVESVDEAYKAKGVRLVLDIADDLPAMPMDPERMGQVMANLLDNALRHTPNGGTVTMSAATSPRTGGVDLSVADSGDGIPAEHLPHVFERFYRVDTARDRIHGGSGIGLAIAKALVDAHGGQLTATSAGVEQGSKFRVLLPADG